MPSKSKRPIFAADSETDPFKRGRVPAPFIWGVVETETGDYDQFTDTREFVEFMAAQNCICYVHNGGKFDFHFLTQFLDDWEPITIISGRLAKFRIGKCEFRDSICIIPAPLAAFQKDEIDYEIFEEAERHKPENWAKICAYLESDCRYLGQMVKQFVSDYGLHLTQATAALKTWEKIADVKKPKTSNSYYDEMQAYYYGGRVQCFEQGIVQGDFQVIDINSAYPYAMINDHPWGQTFGYSENLDGWNESKISRAFIELTAESHGAFPIRVKPNEIEGYKPGLHFPSDGERRKFTITGWEYLAAIETGSLRNAEIEMVRYYYDKISFKEYVDHFFDIKAEASRMLARLAPDHPDFGYWQATRLFAKIFLNSLYGKFASNPGNYAEYMTIPANGLGSAEEIDGWDFCKLLSQETAVVTRPLPEEKHRFYDVAVAASITGFVRAYLWKAISECDGVLYCDTDSIACRSIGNNPIGDKLGQWDIEAQCDYGAIAGKKLYAFRKKEGSFDPERENQFKIASKGVRLKADDIISIAKGEEKVFVPEVPTFSIRSDPIFTPRTIAKRV